MKHEKLVVAPIVTMSCGNGNGSNCRVTYILPYCIKKAA